MITKEIPGGEAEFRTSATELSPRRRRETELLAARLGGILPAVQSAARILCEGDLMEDRSKIKATKGPRKGKLIYTGPDVDLTSRQLRLMSDLNDAIVWSLLASWTLDRPLPASPDDLLDLPADLYDSLRQHAAVIYLELDPSGGFGVQSLPEPGSEEKPDTSLPTSA